jgi:hypothetical protein
MRLLAAQEAGARHPLAFGRSRRRQSFKMPGEHGRTSRCAAGIARVGQMSHAAAVRSPRICGVSNTETGNEDCRLDQESKHGIRPVIALAIFSLPGCDNIMNLNAESLAICGKLLCGEAAAEMVSASSRGAIIMRDSSFRKNTEPGTLENSCPANRPPRPRAADVRRTWPLPCPGGLLPHLPPGNPAIPPGLTSLADSPPGLLETRFPGGILGFSPVAF